MGKGLGTTLKLSEPQRALLVTIKNGQKQIGNVRKILKQKPKLIDDPEYVSLLLSKYDQISLGGKKLSGMRIRTLFTLKFLLSTLLLQRLLI